MGRHETRHMGDGGEVVIPKDMRTRLGIGPGDEVTFETRADGIMILPRNSEESGRSGRGRSASSRSSRSSSRSSGRTSSSSSRSSSRSGGGKSVSGRSGRSTSSSSPRHAERTDDCF